MQVTIIGVSRMRGVGKQSKQPYDMARLFVMSPIRGFSKEGLDISGFGYEVAELPLAANVLGDFANLKYPATVDLLTDMELRGGKLVSVCTGLKQKAA